MIAIRLTQKFLLALACLALVVVVPMSVSAQDNIFEKGAQGVKKGVETGAEKTKEGGEAVGKGVKDTFSSDDQKTTDRESTTKTQQKPSEPATSKSKTESTTMTKGEKGKELPATAGELPLLLLAGGLALAASGTLKLARRTN